MTTRRLILVGGGHAHVHILARAACAPLSKVELILISPFARHHYSGMVPGFLQGTYGEADLAFDLPALAARAGARFIAAAAEGIDSTARTVHIGDERLDYDLLSLDVGSEPAGLATPGVRENGWSIRPMSRAVALRQRAEELFAAGRRRALIVGGGAAGLEVALALERLARQFHVQTGGAEPSVMIVEAAPWILPEFSARVRRIGERRLAARGVRVRAGRQAAAVRPDGVELDDGTVEPSDLTLWLAGAAPPRLLAASNLPQDRQGYLLVDPTLRAVDGSAVFGAGDCIGIAGYPGLAKAGVYAVRESPVLDFNLRAALAGRPPRRYRPQASFLALMNSADGRAIWRWRVLAGHSRAAWWIKDRIDRAYVRRNQQACPSGTPADR